MSARALSNRLNQLVNGELQRLLEESLTEMSELISDFNREQLSDATTSTGRKLKPYSPVTIKIKSETGGIQMNSNIALIDTGDFWNSFIVKAEGNKLEMSATDWKLNILQENFGIDILGLTEENKPKVVSKMYDILSTKLKTFFNV